MVIITFTGVLFSYNLLFFRIDCLKVGLDLLESLNFVTNNSLTGIFHTENGGPGLGTSNHYHHGMLYSLFMFSFFSEVVHYRKSVKQRKPHAAIKGVCHRFSKSVSVDGQKNADKNWSVQP